MNRIDKDVARVLAALVLSHSETRVRVSLNPCVTVTALASRVEGETCEHRPYYRMPSQVLHLARPCATRFISRDAIYTVTDKKELSSKDVLTRQQRPDVTC